jgi:hypothetical protein
LVGVGPDEKRLWARSVDVGVEVQWLEVPLEEYARYFPTPDVVELALFDPAS